MPPVLTGFDSTRFPNDILYGEGVVYIGDEKIGVTRGEPDWDPAVSYENIQFDGKHSDMEQLDRPIYGKATLSFTMLEIGPTASGNQVDKLLPGNSDATVATTTTFTPPLAGALLEEDAYVTDLRVIWERGGPGSGNYFAVYIPRALCVKHGIKGKSKGEAMIPVTFEARQAAGAALNAAPWAYEYRSSLPA